MPEGVSEGISDGLTSHGAGGGVQSTMKELSIVSLFEAQASFVFNLQLGGRCPIVKHFVLGSRQLQLPNEKLSPGERVFVPPTHLPLCLFLPGQVTSSCPPGQCVAVNFPYMPEQAGAASIGLLSVVVCA